MTIHKKLNTGSSFHLNKTESGCCPDDGTTCRYGYVFDDDGVTLTSIVVDGNVVQLGGIDPTGLMSDWIPQIEAKLEAAGYTGDGKVSITAHRGADSLYIDIFSTVVFGDLVTSAATLTASVNCIAAPLCYYEILVDVVADVDFDIEIGKPNDVVGANIAGDYSTGSGDTLATDVETALDGAFDGVNTQPRVKVEEQYGTEEYLVGIWIYKPNGANMYLDGEIIAPKTCSPNYSSAE